MAPQGPPYHVDWVFSNNSNVHLANHRDWFTTFTDFKTHTTTGMEVLGIGEVELDVKTHEKRKGSKSHRKLVLHDVLFAPTSSCNILGGPITDHYDVHFGKPGALKDRKTGATVALLDSVKLMKLWLVGQPKGKSSLDPNQLSWVNAMWGDMELARWESHKMSLKQGVSQPAEQSTQSDVAPYTSAEKVWLKFCGGESEFLKSHGLSIYKEEDRAEGRRILHAMFEKTATSDHDDEDEEKDEEDDEETNDFLADLEADPTSHVADRFFSEAALDWVEKYYRHSGNFLLSRGLKFYDDNDCKEGAAMARAMASQAEAASD